MTLGEFKKLWLDSLGQPERTQTMSEIRKLEADKSMQSGRPIDWGAGLSQQAQMVAARRCSPEYANVVEVERGEHDATLRFYRTRGNGQSLVKELTIPLALLDWLQSDA